MLNRKHLVLLLVVVMVLTLALAGCGGSGQEQSTKEEQKQEAAEGEVLNLSFGTGGTSGTYYPLGGAIANVWNEKIEGINVTVQPAGASVENINRVSAGEVDIVMAMNNIADQAWKGEGKSFPKPLKDFRAVGVVYPEVIHIVTTHDTGITSVAELKGKAVNPGPPGSGTYVTAVEILKAFGIKLSDIKAKPGSFSDAVNDLKDGNIDAAFAVLSCPASAVIDISTSKPVKILEVKGEKFDQLKQAFPLVAQYVIPGGTYKGQDEDAYTVSLQAVLYVRKDLPEDLVYNLAKVMYENTDEIAKGHDRGKQISLERAVNGITTPLHPGAVKYYKEKGIDISGVPTD